MYHRETNQLQVCLQSRLHRWWNWLHRWAESADRWSQTGSTFSFTWPHFDVTTRFAICHFLLVVQRNRASISNRFQDIRSHHMLTNALTNMPTNQPTHMTNRNTSLRSYKMISSFKCQLSWSSSFGVLLFALPSHTFQKSSACFFISPHSTTSSVTNIILLTIRNLFLSLLCLSVILSLSMSRNNTSRQRTWPSHLWFRCLIVLIIHWTSRDSFLDSWITGVCCQLIFSIFPHNHYFRCLYPFDTYVIIWRIVWV